MGLACMAGLLVFTACKKKNDTTSEVELVMPGMAVVDGERAYIDEGYQFNWLANDQVRVYNLDTPDEFGASQTVASVFHNVSGQGPRARFQGPGVGAVKTEGYRYFYPVVMAEGDVDQLQAEGSWNRETFYVSPVQNYNAFTAANHPYSMVDANSMPMSIDTRNLKTAKNLWHIFGAARFTVVSNSEEIEVDSIVITDNVYHLWGTCSLRLHAVDTVKLNSLIRKYRYSIISDSLVAYGQMFNEYVMGMPGNEHNSLGWMSQPGVYKANDPDNAFISTDETKMKSITLNCGYLENGVQKHMTIYPESTNNPTTFAFMLRPLALSHGFKLTFYFTDGREPVIINQFANDDVLAVASRCTRPGIIKIYEIGYRF